MQRVLASGGTNLTKSPPCFISPGPGSHSGMQGTIGTVELSHFLFPLPLFVCHQTCRVTFGRILFTQVNTSGQMKTRCERRLPTFLSRSGFESWHFLPVEKFSADCRKNFLLTQLAHFQFSGAALWFSKPCLFKDVICTAQTRVGPSSDEGCEINAPPLRPADFSRTNNSAGTVILLKPELKYAFPAECKGRKLGFVLSFRLQDWIVLEFFTVPFLAVIYMTSSLTASVDVFLLLFLDTLQHWNRMFLLKSSSSAGAL